MELRKPDQDDTIPELILTSEEAEFIKNAAKEAGVVVPDDIASLSRFMISVWDKD